jgi:hypothetical protein
LIFSPVLTPVQSTHETNLVYESFSVGSLHFVIFEIGGSLSSMTLRCGDDDDADLCYDCVLHPLSIYNYIILLFFPGYYFHHMDSELTVSKFELNYRPPEEFFFKINKINILETEMSAASSNFEQKSKPITKLN